MSPVFCEISSETLTYNSNERWFRGVLLMYLQILGVIIWSASVFGRPCLNNSFMYYTLNVKVSEIIKGLYRGLWLEDYWLLTSSWCQQKINAHLEVSSVRTFPAFKICLRSFIASNYSSLKYFFCGISAGRGLWYIIHQKQNTRLAPLTEAFVYVPLVNTCLFTQRSYSQLASSSFVHSHWNWVGYKPLRSEFFFCKSSIIPESHCANPEFTSTATHNGH